ncbi:unnamed protein product [Rotaria socialis]|uniref:Uncharacterized protein n=1 Tax=Rotaria socialis TaxID=392032 RepID=A0A821M3H3_9BILA|nr:unnamed protein product [Rotaria socialis]CAF3336772.1 unnamed protein product [Rotaria socialis]CAF3448439.1 unnamed protein product [Rotaria socialis]CAF3505342.1 unnamed protein product [Rotaria socialis]CAF4524609.1 unnamed protein product [Rotaria socialis]
MYHHPHFTYNQQQHGNPSNISTKNQQLTTSGDAHPLIKNRARHQCTQNGVTPMESDDNEEQFITVIKKKKKKNSTSSCNTDQSTSSSNTDSGTSNGKPPHKAISANSQAQTRTNEYTSTNTKASTTEISDQSRRSQKRVLHFLHSLSSSTMMSMKKP